MTKPTAPTKARLTAGAREVPLTRGFVALVDENDYSLVSGYKWACLAHKGQMYDKLKPAGGETKP